jgi:hypothetical protein
VKVTSCFIDETGSLGEPSQPLFGVGLLVVRDNGGLTDRLYTVSLNFNSRIRQKRLALQRELMEQGRTIELKELQMLLNKTRHHEYKFTGLTNANINDYIAILNEFFAFTGSEFHAIIFERNDQTRDLYSGAAWPAYIKVTKALLARRLQEPSFICVDWQTRPKNVALSLEAELCDLPYVAGCLRMTSDTSCFLQITDLLLGVVSFDWREAHRGINSSTNARLKRDVSNFVKAKLGMPPSARFLEGDRGYFRRQGSLKFSVWAPNIRLLK